MALLYHHQIGMDESSKQWPSEMTQLLKKHSTVMVNSFKSPFLQSRQISNLEHPLKLFTQNFHKQRSKDYQLTNQLTNRPTTQPTNQPSRPLIHHTIVTGKSSWWPECQEAALKVLLAGALWFHILLDLDLLALHPLIGPALYSLKQVPPLQWGLMYVVEAVSRYVAEGGVVVRGWRGALEEVWM